MFGHGLAKLVNALALKLHAALCGRQRGRTRHTRHINPLAIRRVDQHHASRSIGRGRHALQRVATTKLHGISHACALGVALGKVHHPERHIAAKHRRARLGDGGFCLVKQAFPYVGLKRQVFLKGKTSVDAWRDVAGNLRGFNRNRARATARVIQRHALLAQAFVTTPSAGRKHGSGQGFFQGCVAFVFAPAAFEQRLARRVDVDGDGVDRQVHINPYIGPTGFNTGPDIIELGPEAVSHRILDFERCKIQAGQRAVLRGDVDFEGLLGREPDLPGDVGCGVVQVLLAAVLVVRQLNEHALGQAAVQVELLRIAPGALQLHARPPSLRRSAGNALDFAGQQGFNARSAG